MNEQWKSLFDGTSMRNWKIINWTEGVAIRDHEFACHMVRNTTTTTTTTEHSFLCTEEKFSDFILELEVKLDGDSHSGILLRCIDAPPEAKVRVYGYQVKFDPTPRKWSGGIFDDFGDTWKWHYDLSTDERARNAFILNEWNHFRIEAIGITLKVWVNNIPVTHLIHAKYSNGYIAFKMHALGNESEKEKALVHFKNIRVCTEKPELSALEMDIAGQGVAE